MLAQILYLGKHFWEKMYSQFFDLSLYKTLCNEIWI